MLEHSLFDSEALGLHVAWLRKDVTASGIGAAVKHAATQSYELLFWKCDASCKREECPPKFLDHAMGYLCSTNVTFTTRLKTCQAADRPRKVTELEIRTGAMHLGDKDAFLRLALISGELSRYNMDPCITDYQYKRVYTAWAENCIHGQAADTILIAYFKNQIAGMATIQVVGNKAVIGLLSVFPQLRRKGIASGLLEHARAWAVENNANMLEVSTQIHNMGAIRLYKSFGLQESSKAAIYHLWTTHCASVKLNVPYFAGDELTYIQDMISRQDIRSCGKYTSLCREKISSMLHCNHVLVTGSATAALEQAMILLNICQDDEVIVPSYTFVSTANAVVLRGGVPVFVDIGRDGQIDPSAVEEAITPRTRCIIAVHYAGQSCDMDSIMAIASRHSLFVVEDAAQGFLSTYNGQYLGTIGHIGCISFHYTKNTMCGEGGALLVNDTSLVSRSYVVWEKGTNRYDFVCKKVDRYNWIDVGSSYVTNEMAAAFLYSQLQAAEYCRSRRVSICRVYRRFLAKLVDSGFVSHMEHPPPGCMENGHIFFIVLQHQCTREKLQLFMEKRNVQLFSHYCPLHSSPGGLKFGRPHGLLSESVEFSSTLLRLPIYVQMTFTHVHKVIQGIYEFFEIEAPSSTDVMHGFLNDLGYE